MGSAADVRFSLSTATHAPPGLQHRYSALREESAKVRGWKGECPGRLSGEFGVSPAACLAPVSQTAGVQCKTSPSSSPPCPPIPTTAAALGLGPCQLQQLCPTPCLGLLVGKRWGLAGSQPVLEAPLKRVHVCQACGRVLLVVGVGDAGAEEDWQAFWKRAVVYGG